MVESQKNINHLGSTEFVLLKRLSLISIFISFTGFFINFFIGFSTELLLIPSVSFVIYSLIYFLIIKNKNKNLFTPKVIFTSYTLIVLNILWYYNFGSYGPAPYFFIFMFSVFLFLWEGFHLVVLSIVLAINIIVLFLLEFFIEGFISTYSSESARIIDVYTSLFFYGAIISLLIVYARQRIVKEYKMAKQSDMLKTSFLNNISHEIRTPLNGIIGNSNMLVEYRDIDEVTQKRFVSEIKKSKDELLDNLNQILEVSSLIAGDLAVNKEKFDIETEFKSIFQNYKIQCENKGLDFRYEFIDTEKSIKTDKTLLKKCIDNIFNNSLKFTKKGYIKISVKKENNYLIINIYDTGIGINTKHYDLIFDQFYKVEDHTEEVYRGLGLGLFQSKKIVEKLKGKIDVKSELNKYAEIIISIPYN